MHTCGGCSYICVYIIFCLWSCSLIYVLTYLCVGYCIQANRSDDQFEPFFGGGVPPNSLARRGAVRDEEWVRT